MSDQLQCIVLWRAGQDQPWHAQPYVYTAGQAAALARRMLDASEGEVCVQPINPPRQGAPLERGDGGPSVILEFRAPA